ncbi:hypothetical protein Tco_1468149 [Tanacetum coccineum]
MEPRLGLYVKLVSDSKLITRPTPTESEDLKLISEGCDLRKDIKVADWSDNVALFGSAVIKSAVTWDSLLHCYKVDLKSKLRLDDEIFQVREAWMMKCFQVREKHYHSLQQEITSFRGPLDPDNIDQSGQMDSWTMMQTRATVVMSSDTSPYISAGGRLTTCRPGGQNHLIIMMSWWSSQKTKQQVKLLKQQKKKNRMKQVEQPVETIDEIDQLLETNEISLENFTTSDKYHVTPQVHLRNTLPSKSKKRKLEEDAFTLKIISSLNNLADAIDRTTKVMESSRPHVYSEAEIYQELQLMGVKREDISHAYLFLVGNPKKTRALFGFPIEMRLEFLATLMDGNE